jgi:hypothetical protein
MAKLNMGLDLAIFVLSADAQSARTVKAGFGGAKQSQNPPTENGARSELAKTSLAMK